MSQSQNNITNGPNNEATSDSKEPQTNQEMAKTAPNGTAPKPHFGPQFPNENIPPRPQLIRIDSRSALGVRPGFPNQAGVPFRPPQIRPPPGGTQYVQRPPFPRPPGQPFLQNQAPRFNVPPNGQVPLNSTGQPVVRPPTPFQRPQGPRPPVLTQQRSFPVPGSIRPPLNTEQPRGETLDSAGLNVVVQPQNDIYRTPSSNVLVEGDRPSVIEAEKAAMIAAMKTRSFSLSSAGAEMKATEDRRRSVSSVGSNEDSRPSSAAGFTETKPEKPEIDIPPRAESSAGSHMNKIEEDDDDVVVSHDRSKSSTPTKSSTPSKSPLPTSTLIKTPTPTKSPVTSDSSDNGTVKSVPPDPKPALLTSAEILLPRPPSSTASVPSPINSSESNKAVKMEEVKNDEKKVLEEVNKIADLKKFDGNSPDKSIDSKKFDGRTLDLNREDSGKRKPVTKTEGDNDSGVDESTQGNENLSNGDQHSPKKSIKAPSPRTANTPTKNKSITRGSKSPHSKTPDLTSPSTPGPTEKKKVPMNKVQVGSAPSPNLKVVKSKIGSLDNTTYKPGGGNVKIESRKIDFTQAQSRIAAKNDTYTPGGGDKKIQQQKLAWNAKSKIGSLENAAHKPKGGEKKIESVKLDFKEKAKPKVGSKDNMKHVAGGGDIKSEAVEEDVKKDVKKEIENKKVDIKVQSKIGSLDNVKHKPGGGDKKIFDDKEYLRQMSAHAAEQASLSGSQKKKAASPETNLISPGQEKVRILETVPENTTASRPQSRLSRSGSTKKRPWTPKGPWRY